MADRSSYAFSDTLSYVLKDKNTSQDTRVAVIQSIEGSIEEYNKLRSDHNGSTAAFNFASAAGQDMKKVYRRRKAQGRENLSCRKGCSFCCHYHIDITDDEAEMILEAAANAHIELDIPTLELQAGHAGVENWRKLDYEDRRCPMLTENDECGIYNYRPINCRTLLVTSPRAKCDTSTGNHNVKRILAVNAEIIHAATINARPWGNMAKMLLEAMNKESLPNDTVK